MRVGMMGYDQLNNYQNSIMPVTNYAQTIDYCFEYKARIPRMDNYIKPRLTAWADSNQWPQKGLCYCMVKKITRHVYG
ncbi:MAG: hypothetical protein ACI9YL_001119 [Luteibaculaceae bacterium]|jgi:hypothetical protein